MLSNVCYTIFIVDYHAFVKKLCQTKDPKMVIFVNKIYFVRDTTVNRPCKQVYNMLMVLHTAVACALFIYVVVFPELLYDIVCSVVINRSLKV